MPPDNNNNNNNNDNGDIGSPEHNDALNDNKKPRTFLRKILNRFKLVIEELAQIEQHEDGRRSRGGTATSGQLSIDYDYDISIGIDSHLQTEKDRKTKIQAGNLSGEIDDNDEPQANTTGCAPHIQVQPRKDGLDVIADLPDVDAEMVDVQIDSDRGELVIMIAHKSLGDMNKSKPIDNTQQGEYTNTGEITERIAIPSGIQISDTRFKNHVLTVHLQEREK